MFYKERLHLRDSQRLERWATLDQQAGFKLFVGGLNKSTSEEVLFQYFSQFGDVSHVEIARSPNRKSKGYGYVCFKDEQGKAKALRANLHLLDNARLRVEQAFDPDYRQAKHVQLAERRLYLSGIPSTATQEEIYELLTQFGYTVSVTNLRRSNPYSNPNSFYCYVTMDRPSAVMRILQQPGLYLYGRHKIHVKPFTARSKGLGGSIIEEHSSREGGDAKYSKSKIDKSLSTIASPNQNWRSSEKRSTLNHPGVRQLWALASATQSAPQQIRPLQTLYRVVGIKHVSAQDNLDRKLGQQAFDHRDINLRFNLRRPATSGFQN